MKKTTFKKLALASAIGSLMAANSIAEASQVAYSMYNLYSGNTHRLADLPVNHSPSTGAIASSNPSHSNYLAPTDWRDASGTVVTSPNYGWTHLGGLPATWWVSIGGNDSASVNSDDFIAARRAGGFLGGPSATGNTTAYIGSEPTALTVGAASYADINISGSGTNWGHNADFGLLTVTQTSNVTISISGVSAASGLLRGAGSQNLIPGFSVWQGWDSGDGTRHTNWTGNGYIGLSTGTSSPVFAPAAVSMTLGGDPRSDSGLSFMGTAWDTVANGTATLTLNNLLAGNYYIALGGVTDKKRGYVASGPGAVTRQYQVSITTTAVPLPAAAWLFGPALAGLGVIGRRKQKVAA